ncbi:MAG TPA: isoprenylcysteine carboxylmethyltransferase family protein [Jiangellaceae bacterium]|nr:isoprenylcysteine carboxylmethyltransferase family protein [Jiangellaceae bacterium]
MVVIVSLAHFVLAPGVVVGVVPWLLTGWQSHDPAWAGALQLLGWAMVAVGVAVIALSFVRFVTEGMGTPAPVVPTRKLVVGGFYRYVRNPMYVAVVAAIAGQALVLSRVVLLAYAGVIWLTVAAFVHWYEEPALRRRFGTGYDEYRRAVPAWRPRLHPWAPAVTPPDRP